MAQPPPPGVGAAREVTPPQPPVMAAGALSHQDGARHADGRLQLRRRTVRRSPWRVWGRRVLLTLLALIVVVGVVTVVQSVRARADLVAGREAMERGRSAMVRSDLEEALSAFEQARTSFRAAEGDLANPVVAAAAAVPVAGDTVQTARTLSRAGTSVAEAGIELAGGALRLPEGLATLAPIDGVIPVRAVAAIAPFLQRAADLVDVALHEVESAPGGAVLGVVAEARQQFLGQISQIDGLLQASATLSEALPSFLGSEGPRRYFFGAQSLAEARSLGGCICAYTLLEVDRGQLRFGEFVTTTTIGGTAVDAPPPTEEFGRRYAPFGSAGLLSTVNYSADLPTVAQAILNIYEHVEGERLDGVILADAYVLEALVRATGPVDIPDVGVVPASEVVATLSNDAYDALPDSDARKALLGQVAAATVEGFLQRGAASDPVRAARVLVEAGGGGHLQMFATHPDEQAALLETGLSGSLMTPPDPGGAADVTIGVFSNNTGANKTDFYTDRVVEVDMRLLPSGGAVATVAVTHTNETPTSDLPIDVIGPNTEGVEVGQNRLVTSLWCRGGCQLIGAGRDGTEVGLTADREAGFDVFTINQLLEPGGEETITFDVLLPTVASDGEMSLRFANQASINPTRLRVDVEVPEGQQVHDRGDFVQADGFWTWQQLPGPLQDLSLTVGPPDDLWSRTLRLLNTRL